MTVIEMVKGLSGYEKQFLYDLLKKDLGSTPQLEEVRAEQNKEVKVVCPHCHCPDILGHGAYKGRKRYKCKKCKKTFNDFTGTAISGLKKVNEFQEYLELVMESVTIRKAASALSVSTRTIFDWRHKLLSCLSGENGRSFSGIVECDDKQSDISEKGSRKLSRDAYKRPSDRKTKRGVSNDKVSIMVAMDREDNPTMRVAKIGRVDVSSIERTIGVLTDSDNILCSDSHPSIISWASGRKLEHHTFVASRQHVKNKCYHVQHVNSLDNRYERWVKRFYGIATKYLPQYLNWFVFLEKMKKSTDPIAEMAKVVTTDIGATKIFREIEKKYLNLIEPHYSAT